MRTRLRFVVIAAHGPGVMTRLSSILEEDGTGTEQNMTKRLRFGVIAAHGLGNGMPRGLNLDEEGPIHSQVCAT